MDLENLKKQFLPLGNRPEIELIVLFGSHAKNHAKPDSDLDIAILSNKPLDVDVLNSEIISFTHINNIDLVDLQHCDPVLGMRIMEEGKILFEKPGVFPQLASYFSRRYADTKKFRILQEQYIQRKLQEHAAHEPD